VTLDVDEERARMVPAFEAVAGTLTHLHIDKTEWCSFTSDEADMGYELGVAVGKLRRLKDLSLGLSRDGRFYHAMAQGLAAGENGRPLPLLWRVILLSEVRANADLLTSLLLPSVRVFHSHHVDSRAALLTACALRQAAYKHTWVVWCDISRKHRRRRDELLRVLRSVAAGCSRLVDTWSEVTAYPWTISPDGRLPAPDDE
jgi:hypothetical protein